jgi:acyl dehydratase
MDESATAADNAAASAAAARARVAEDQNGKRTSFEEIEVGKLLGEMDWEVTDEMIAKQCLMDADYHSWYMGDSPWGARVAPPQISYRPPRWLLSRTYNIRGLFYKWEFENLAPLHPGVRLHVKAHVVDKYIRKEREFVVFGAEGVDPEGRVVFRTRRTHVLDVLDRTAGREGKGVDSGVKAEKI